MQAFQRKSWFVERFIQSDEVAQKSYHQIIGIKYLCSNDSLIHQEQYYAKVQHLHNAWTRKPGSAQKAFVKGKEFEYGHQKDSAREKLRKEIIRERNSIESRKNTINKRRSHGDTAANWNINFLFLQRNESRDIKSDQNIRSIWENPDDINPEH